MATGCIPVSEREGADDYEVGASKLLKVRGKGVG